MPITNDDRYQAAMAAMQTEESMAEQQRGVLDAMHQKAKANHAEWRQKYAAKTAAAGPVKKPDQVTPASGTTLQAVVPPPYPTKAGAVADASHTTKDDLKDRVRQDAARMASGEKRSARAERDAITDSEHPSFIGYE